MFGCMREKKKLSERDKEGFGRGEGKTNVREKESIEIYPQCED